MHELLTKIDAVSCLEPQGAFYCFPNFTGVLEREIAGRRPADTLQLCELLLEEVKVAVVPGEAFGAPGYARMSFALGDEDLEEGVSRIAKLLG
jgi:aspartate/methionine/tyrosine aminotransferase